MRLVDRRRHFRPHEVEKGAHSKGCAENFPSKHGKCVKRGCLNVSAVTLSERMTGAVLLALVLIMGGILLQNVRRRQGALLYRC